MKAKQQIRFSVLVFLLAILGMSCSLMLSPRVYKVESIEVEFQLEPDSPLLGDEAYILGFYSETKLGLDTGIYVLEEYNQLVWYPKFARLEGSGSSYYVSYTFFVRLGKANKLDAEKQNAIYVSLWPSSQKENQQHTEMESLDTDYGTIPAEVTIFYSDADS